MAAPAYKVVSKLGSGGLGTVYKAQTEAGESVALKVLFQDASQGIDLDALRARVAVLAGLTHPASCRPSAVVMFDGKWAVVSELVDGVDLTTVLTGGPVPLRAALQIIAELAAALAEAAALVDGPPHGDIKLSNVLLSGDGSIKLVDLGLAGTPLRGVVDPDATMFFASVGYMAPERLADGSHPRADVYGLGLVLHELLTTARPHRTSSNPERHAAYQAQLLQGLHAVCGEHEGLDTLVRSLTAFEAEDRPDFLVLASRCGALADALDGPVLSEWAHNTVAPLVAARQEFPLVESLGTLTGKVVRDETPAPAPRRGEATPPMLADASTIPWVPVALGVVLLAAVLAAVWATQ